MTAPGSTTALIIFAKAPVPGQVKTRLIPALGADGAAGLYKRMLRRTVDTACQADIGTIELYCTPDTGHEEFRALSRRYSLVSYPQRGPDLGSRMYQAMARALRHNTKVVLVGCDCPQIEVSDLIQADASLTSTCPLVLGPARDGGYVLLGARKLDPRLFSDIPWGTARVLTLTRQRARQLGWQLHELRMFQDVDRPEDLPFIADLPSLEACDEGGA